VFQFDQPELMGVEKLSADFGGRTAFFCPVDIQRILAGGNKAPIQREAEKMIKCFGGYNGGFIAKDYPSLDDIGVKDEWAQWARDIFVSEGSYI
jgi:uroporphyrinogen decarboxylase